MVVVEMAFAQEEENGIPGGGGSGRRDVVRRGGGSGAASSGCSWPTATRARRPQAGGHATQNRGGGELTCGPHGTVSVGQVKRRLIDFKINLNRFK
jgi:hypothetical protein